MTTLDQAIAGARRHARSAALRNTGLQACPYPADGTPTQSAARRTWIRSYRHHRPDDAVDYSGDLDDLAYPDDADDQDGGTA